MKGDEDGDKDEDDGMKGNGSGDEGSEDSVIAFSSREGIADSCDSFPSKCEFPLCIGRGGIP